MARYWHRLRNWVLDILAFIGSIPRCDKRHPDRSVKCERHEGHEGMHKGMQFGGYDDFTLYWSDP